MTNLNGIKLVVAVICFVAAAVNAVDHCELPIGARKHFTSQWPLVFTSAGELYPSILVDNERLVRVEKDAVVLISCSPNYIKKFYKVEVLKAVCNGEKGNFKVTDTAGNLIDVVEMSASELTCDLRVIEEVLQPVEGCPLENIATRFGYLDPLEKNSLVIGEACFDSQIGRTLWAHVKLNAAGQPGYLEKAAKSYLTAHPHPESRYKMDFFRELQFDELYERMRSRVHVAEAPALKLSNFIDEPLLNSDQFQAVKKLGWNYFVTHDDLNVLATLKADIKTLSQRLDLDVYVGSNGVYTLHGKQGAQMDVYAQEAPHKRFPIPGIVWFVVRHQEQAIAFGIFNDVAVTSAQVTNANLCSSVCEQLTWMAETTKMPVPQQLPLVCCSYNELKQTVKELPQLEGIHKLLV